MIGWSVWRHARGVLTSDQGGDPEQASAEKPVAENKPVPPRLDRQRAPLSRDPELCTRGSVAAQGLNSAPITGGFNNDPRII